LGEREVRAGTYPISIDFKGFVERAACEKATEYARIIRQNLQVEQLVLGVDRLDYTKGIPYRLAAFGYALERYPELRGKISLVQVVVPSRTSVPKYQELKIEIERLVGEVNGKFTMSGWVPIHYLFRNLASNELLGYYRAADIALITPLKDGMNLIAKEYCAVQLENHGTLILSEFAGASSQLHKDAVLVNPYHIEEVADAIRKTFHFSDDQRRSRMKKLRRRIRKQDVFWWVDSILKSGNFETSGYLPILDEYMPQLDLREKG
jgi:trehalose 6-phosphate synthase